MKKNVILTANPTTGAVFTLALDAQGNPKKDKNGKAFGSIRLEQSIIDLDFSYNNGGVKKLSALKAMTAEAWEKVKNDLKPGMEFPGKIRVVETTDANLHKAGVGTGFQIKKAGSADDAETLVNNGLPIFRRTEYVSDENVADILVQHSNVIKATSVTTNPQAATTLN